MHVAHRNDGSFGYVDITTVLANGGFSPWRRVPWSTIPDVPTEDLQVSMQVWNAPRYVPHAHDSAPPPHTGPLVLEFDAHVWTPFDLAYREMQRTIAFLQQWIGPPLDLSQPREDLTPDERTALRAYWGSDLVPGLDVLDFDPYFSGGAGFHLMIPPAITGMWCSPWWTTACGDIATFLKDHLQLWTLDAHTTYNQSCGARSVERWAAYLAQQHVVLPAALHPSADGQWDALRTFVRARGSFYGTRRVVRASGVRRASGLCKIPLTAAEVADTSETALRQAAATPRPRRTYHDKRPHPLCDKMVLYAMGVAATNWQQRQDEVAAYPVAKELAADTVPPPCVSTAYHGTITENSNPTLLFLISFYLLGNHAPAAVLELLAPVIANDNPSAEKLRERTSNAEAKLKHIRTHRRFYWSWTYAVSNGFANDQLCAGCSLQRKCAFVPPERRTKRQRLFDG